LALKLFQPQSFDLYVKRMDYSLNEVVNLLGFLFTANFLSNLAPWSAVS
jgi:hypothetical protein